MIPARMSASLSTFCAAFRASMAASLEYSISDDVNMFSTMVRGDGWGLGEIGTFVVGTIFAGDWYSAASRMFRQIQPPLSLFRVDWYGERPIATTLYLKFPHAPSESEFEHVLAAARPYRWSGPSPGTAANVLGLAGPTGVALRSRADGIEHISVYYRLEGTGWFSHDSISRLLEAAGLPVEAERIVTDSVTLARTCPLSVVGLDGGSSKSPATLKLDWSEVPPRSVYAVLVSKGIGAQALRRLDELSTGLRARRLSYFGMKYDAAGFAGWRAYFSTEPHRYAGLGAPLPHTKVRLTDRMPHY